MKRLFGFIFASLFFFSIASGEKLCCGLGESKGAAKTTISDVLDIDSIDANTHSDSEDHDSHHQCLGCSHSPVMGAKWISVVRAEIKFENNFLEFYHFIPHPFLDGPFQPPKA